MKEPTYVRSSTSLSSASNIVIIKMGKITVINRYKLPVTIWPQQVLGSQSNPSLYIEDHKPPSNLEILGK